MMNHLLQAITRKKWLLLCLILAGCGAGGGIAVMVSQYFKMQSQQVGSGGSSASTNFAMKSTINDPAAGKMMVSTHYALQGGFAP